MPCTRPLAAYHAPGGGIAWSSKTGYGDRPLELPCGQCWYCRQEKAKAWALRAVHEAQLHPRNAFVTLTYDNQHLPPDGSLDVRHWQLFAKRVRKEIGPFRFLHCGEYGETNRRPHYHACVFGLDFQPWLGVPDNSTLCTSPSLESLWGQGFVTVGRLTYESAAYVARYCMKKLTGPRRAEYGSLRPPYATMSRRPGLGAEWLARFQSDVFPADEVVHEGRRHRPPRFYTDRLPPSMQADMRAKRMLAASKPKVKADNTPARLRVKEQVAEKQHQARNRNL